MSALVANLAKKARHTPDSCRLYDGSLMIEFVETVLERGDFRLKFGHERIDRGLPDLRGVFDVISGLRVATAFLEKTVADIKGLERRNKTLQFGKTEDARIQRRVGHGDGGFHFDERVEFRAQIREHLVRVIVERNGGRAGIL